MIIRPYNHDDYRCILSIYANAKLDELKFENSTFTLVPLTEDTIRFDALFNADIYVAEINGKICGYGAMSAHEIKSIFVHQHSRRQGVGKSLLIHMLKKIEYPARLSLVKSNSPAKSFYEQFQFKQVAEFTAYYHGTSVQAITMQLEHCVEHRIA